MFANIRVLVVGIAGVLTAGPGATLMLAAHSTEQTLDRGAEIPLSEKPADAAAPANVPAERPAWVDELPVRVGLVHTTTVSSGPHLRMRECVLALDLELKQATDEYVAWYLGNPAASNFIDLDLKYINTHLRREQSYTEVRDYSVGPMQTAYAQLQFDEPFRNYLDERWEQEVAKGRLLQTGLVGGAVLALLGVLFAYFRLDTATRGFYTGRLQFLAVGAILALAAAGVLAARWIPWL